MKRKRIRTLVATGLLVSIVTVGGIMAYFTDQKEADNVFTVGKISIELEEPSWEPENGVHIVPLKTIPKDPQILNNGNNPEFVFLEVTLPYMDVTTCNADGSVKGKAFTQMYTYSITPGWVELGSPKTDEKAQTITRLYAYGTKNACTVLPVGSKTSKLFEQVQFVNIVEDETLEGSQLNIKVVAHAIQSDYLDGGKTSPTDVWGIYKAR